MIDVCLLGIGGMMPLPDRPLAATAFRIGSETYLFDCGEGTQVNWRNSNFSYRGLGNIFLSHLHADHVTGLPGVLFQIAFSGRQDPVKIFGPVQTPEIVTALCSVIGGLPFELRVTTLTGGEQIELPDDLSVSTLKLQHRRPCLGYRFDLRRKPQFKPEAARRLGVPVEKWSLLQSGTPVDGIQPEQVTAGPRRGLRLALVTDTSALENLTAFVSESDLLVCESTYVDDADIERAEQRGHLTMSQAAAVASEANVGNLWLTHFSPKVKQPAESQAELSRLFSQARIGYPGLTTTLSFDA